MLTALFNVLLLLGMIETFNLATKFMKNMNLGFSVRDFGTVLPQTAEESCTFELFFVVLDSDTCLDLHFFRL